MRLCWAYPESKEVRRLHVRRRNERTENVRRVVGVKESDEVEAKVTLKPNDIRRGAVEHLQITA